MNDKDNWLSIPKKMKIRKILDIIWRFSLIFILYFFLKNIVFILLISLSNLYSEILSVILTIIIYIIIVNYPNKRIKKIKEKSESYTDEQVIALSILQITIIFLIINLSFLV